MEAQFWQPLVVITSDIKPCCCCRSCFFLSIPHATSFFLFFNRPMNSGCFGKNTNITLSFPWTVLSVLVRSGCACLQQQPITAGKHANVSNCCVFLPINHGCCSVGVKNHQLTVKITVDSSETPCFLSNPFLRIFGFGKMSHFSPQMLTSDLKSSSFLGCCLSFWCFLVCLYVCTRHFRQNHITLEQHPAACFLLDVCKAPWQLLRNGERVAGGRDSRTCSSSLNKSLNSSFVSPFQGLFYQQQ